MKNLILIITLLFASSVMAMKLTEIESGEAKLEALNEIILTADAEYKKELSKDIKKTEKAIKKAKKINLINVKKEAKRVVKHNKHIDKKIENVNNLDLNKNDLCAEYIVRYEQEKNERVVILERVKGTNSCFSRYELSSETALEIPFVTHEELIAYFNEDLVSQIDVLLGQKK